MQQTFAIISAMFILIAAPPYIFDIIRGKTKPERVTWLIFSVLGIIAFVSQLLMGASWSLVFSGLDTTASILIFALSINYGVGGYTRLDIVALLVASAGVLIALFVKEPIISLLGVIIADLSGMVLTVKKSFINPESETTITWLLVGTASVFGILAAGNTSIQILLYPVYLMVANYSVPIAQLLGKRYSKAQRS